MAEFVATLLHSGTVAHFMHWATDSYAEHKALQKYYEAIPDLADQLAEAYMGRNEQLKQFPEEFHSAKNPIKYFETLREFVDEERDGLPSETEIQNLVDEIAQLIDSTLYKLRFLK